MAGSLLKLTLKNQPVPIGCRAICFTARLSAPEAHRRQTHYEVLKLPHTCTQDQIREAFIQLSKQYHPDTQTSHQKNASKLREMSAMFVRINEAYQTLGKPAARREYDAFLSGRSGVHAGHHYGHGPYRSDYRGRQTAYHDEQWYWGANRQNFHRGSYWSSQGGHQGSYSEEADEFVRQVEARRRSGVMLCVYIVIFSVAMHLFAYSFARDLMGRNQDKRRQRFLDFYDVDESTHRSRLFASLRSHPPS